MPMPRKSRRDCRYCGAECPRPEAVYCSQECQHRYQYFMRVQDVFSHGDLQGYSAGFKRRFILDLCGTQCEICDLTTWRGQDIPLELDHINGNSEDDRIENLRMVCGNCAMQLPTYKSRNRGKGRHWRRERYAAGKSY